MTDRFHRVGNHLAADFANTRWARGHAEGSLRTPRDVVDFLTETGALSATQAADARRELRRPAAGKRMLRRTINFRTIVARVLESIASGKPATDSDIELINAVLESDAGYFSIQRAPSGIYALAFLNLRASDTHLLVPVARALAELLAAGHPKVRRCANKHCIRLFVDASHAGRRRWCDMSICGNRAKVFAFQQRQKERA